MSLSHKLFKHLPPLDKNPYYFLNFQPAGLKFISL